MDPVPKSEQEEYRTLVLIFNAQMRVNDAVYVCTKTPLVAMGPEDVVKEIMDTQLIDKQLNLYPSPKTVPGSPEKVPYTFVAFDHSDGNVIRFTPAGEVLKNTEEKIDWEFKPSTASKFLLHTFQVLAYPEMTNQLLSTVICLHNYLMLSCPGYKAAAVAFRDKLSVENGPVLSPRQKWLISMGLNEDVYEYLLHLVVPSLLKKDQAAEPEEWFEWTLEYMVTGEGYLPERQKIYGQVADTLVSLLKSKYLKRHSVRITTHKRKINVNRNFF